MAALDKNALMAQLKANYTLLYMNPTNKELQTQFFGVIEQLHRIAPEKRGTRRVSLGGPSGRPLGGPSDGSLGGPLGGPSTLPRYTFDQLMGVNKKNFNGVMIDNNTVIALYDNTKQSLQWLPKPTVTDIQTHHTDGMFSIRGNYKLLIAANHYTLSLPNDSNSYEIYRFFKNELIDETINYALKFEQLDKGLMTFGSILTIQIDHGDGNYSDLPSNILPSVRSLVGAAVNRIEVGVLHHSNDRIAVENNVFSRIELHVGTKKYPLVFFTPYTWDFMNVDGYDAYDAIRFKREEILEQTTDFCGKFNENDAFGGFITPNDHAIHVLDNANVKYILGLKQEQFPITSSGNPIFTVSKHGTNYMIQLKDHIYSLYLFTRIPLTSKTVNDFTSLQLYSPSPQVQNAIRLQASTVEDPCEYFNLTPKLSRLCLDFANNRPIERKLLYTYHDRVTSMGFEYIEDKVHLFLSNEKFLISFLTPKELNGHEITPQNDEEETKENHDPTVFEYFEGLIIPRDELKRFQLTSCELWQKDEIFLLLLGFPMDSTLTITDPPPLVERLLIPREPHIHVWIESQNLNHDRSSDTIQQRFARFMLRDYNGNFNYSVSESKFPDQDTYNSFIRSAIVTCNYRQPDEFNNVKKYTDFMDEIKDKNIEIKLQKTIEFFIEKSPDLKNMFEVEVGGNFIFKKLFQKVATQNISVSEKKDVLENSFTFLCVILPTLIELYTFFRVVTSRKNHSVLCASEKSLVDFKQILTIEGFKNIQINFRNSK